jgi:DnaK suppressor protein
VLPSLGPVCRAPHQGARPGWGAGAPGPAYRGRCATRPIRVLVPDGVRVPLAPPIGAWVPQASPGRAGTAGSGAAGSGAAGSGAEAREALLAERAGVVRREAALDREFTQLADAASAGGTDDEHDPEGATLAFERQHTAALLDQAREQVAAIDAGPERLDAGRYGLCGRCGQPIGA